MDLAEFIDAERVTIVAEWEAFAHSLLPEAGGMSPLALRDHGALRSLEVERDGRRGPRRRVARHTLLVDEHD